MTLSIIIPTYKRADQAAKLLDSIAEQEFPYEDLQVLLISNLRDKKLRKQIPHWRSLFFDFKYKEVGDVGVNKARNMGIRFAGGDILYFLDDDCLLPNKHHLQSLILEHKQNPSAIGIGGGYKSMEFLYGSEKFYHEHSQKWIEDFVSSQKETSQLVGGNASYKRGVFDKGFYFDPLIIFGGSEESFNQSLKKESYTLLYSEKLWVFHLIKLKWFSLAKKSFGQGFGLFTSRYQSGQTIQSLQNMKTDWAFSVGKFSFYPFIYTLFFKLGYFWGASFFIKKNFIFRFFYFVLLLIKSRLYFLKEYFIPRFYGSVFLSSFGTLWYVLGWLYGHVFLRFFGALRYVLGWFYGSVFLSYFLRFFGGLKYILGWLYGHVFLRFFGGLKYILGWLYGHVFLRFFGGLKYILGWLYGHVFLRFFGALRYVLGWFYGSVFLSYFLRFFGGLKYILGWLYGHVFLRFFGGLKYILGWLYGHVFLRFFGALRYVLGWFYGSVFLSYFLRFFGGLKYILGWLYGHVFLRFFGALRYVLGWLYGHVFLRFFGALRYVLGWFYGSVFLRGFGALWYALGWLYGHVFLRFFGALRYVLGWFYGSVFLRGFGALWYALGWLYGHMFLFIFHHSPPMKLYYFSEYQYYKRIKPFLSKIKASRK